MKDTDNNTMWDNAPTTKYKNKTKLLLIPFVVMGIFILFIGFGAFQENSVHKIAHLIYINIGIGIVFLINKKKILDIPLFLLFIGMWFGLKYYGIW